MLRLGTSHVLSLGRLRVLITITVVKREGHIPQLPSNLLPGSQEAACFWGVLMGTSAFSPIAVASTHLGNKDALLCGGNSGTSKHLRRGTSSAPGCSFTVEQAYQHLLAQSLVQKTLQVQKRLITSTQEQRPCSSVRC